MQVPPNSSAGANEVDALYADALAAWQAGRFEAALRLARAAIALEPRLPALHYLAASALLELDKADAAAGAYEAAVSLDPPYPLALHCAAGAALARARGDIKNGAAPLLEVPQSRSAGKVSVIVCSIDANKFARVSAAYARLLEAIDHEIIAIHDARSLAEGYNRGIRRSRGEILIFSHDDVDIVSPDFGARLLHRVATQDLIGVAGTSRATHVAWPGAGWPHLHGQIGMPASADGFIVTLYDARGPTIPGAQALDGAFLACRREVAEEIGFDQTTFDGWHGYDFDFSFRAHLSGYRCAICADLLVVHGSRGNYDSPEWVRCAERAGAKFRDRLPEWNSAPAQPELCSVEVRSGLEWQLFNARLYGTPRIETEQAR